MKQYAIFLIFCLILVACGEQPVNLNQIIPQETILELVNPQNVEESAHTDKLWLATDVLQKREELHGQIVSVVGYIGWQGQTSNVWHFAFWNEPVGNYEDMWKYGRHKEYANDIEKWGVCWTNCWSEGQDYGTIRYASSFARFRAPELTDPDPNLLFDGNLQEEPKIRLKSLDKYVLKVLVRDWDPGAGLTLVEIVDHIEMPPEQPPESINEGNPISVKVFKEQYENFYDQTVSVVGWMGYFETTPHGIDLFTFWNESLNIPHLDEDRTFITVLFPYNERPYYWKFTKQQGLRGDKKGGEYVLKIHVHSPETHTVRLILPGVEVYKELPFVILWVDRKVESE